MEIESLFCQPNQQQNEPEVVTFLYEPFAQQRAFHNDRYRVRHRAVFSGVGGGKTLCGCFEILMILLDNPGAVGYIFEPTYKMVRRILIPTLEGKQLLGRPLDVNPLVSDYRKGDNCIQFRDGQELWFGGLEEPEYAEGANVDAVLIDEAQYIRKFDEAHDVVLRRLRGSGKTERNITQSIITTTPPPLTQNNRLYNFFENPKTRNPKSKIYRWSMLENIHLPEEYKIEMVATHSNNSRKRFIEGLFAPIGTGSFDFDQTIHVKTFPENFLKSMKYFTYGIDWGWTNPTAIIVSGFDSDGRVFVFDEFYERHQGNAETFAALKDFILTYGNGSIYCDGSAPENIEYMNRAGRSDRDFDKKGIIIKAEKFPHKRQESVRELGARFKIQADGKSRIFINSKCVNLISELIEFQVTIKERDHAVDALRYGIPLKDEAPVDAWVFG
jgi:hypothetical protein